VRCPARKIHVIPLGVSPAFAPSGDDARTGEFRRRFNLADRILLYVGSLKPHKNFSAVLRSLSDLRERKDLQVVCVGEKLEENAPLKALCADLGVGDRVRSLGWLPDADLIEAYRAATALLMPSFYEGFGFPVLEAMACGTPVVASNAASIPEVAGDAGILFDPSAGGGLTDAVRAVLDDAGLRKSMRVKGLQRARQFTWERCADATLKLYRTVG
ncbi:MAG TPA: glycosyltransferase family 1 protein, partial [Bacteroidota bacterium]|nr:glycosyltransferase family 1 protein [Bacteroidota bacterium]